MACRVFVDFDGTITRTDVGNAFFECFGGPECGRLVAEYRQGTLSAVDCFRKEVAAVGSVNSGEACTFVRRQQTDPSFPAFVAFCRANGMDVCIVSDGLDYYIGEILNAIGTGDIPFYANHLVMTPDGAGNAALSIAFPHTDAECTRCACCKRNLMITRSAEEDVIVLVGEGSSDRCPAQYADIVFAKDVLQTYCQQQNISYFPYASFGDVTCRLSALHGAGQLRKRRRAEVMRRQAFISE